MGEETVAEAVARMLAERDLMLGTVECATDGIIARRIFDAPDGPDVLGYSLVVDTVEEAIGLLDLPRPQFRKAGDFSAKAARAAAREGRAFLGVDVCLAVWAWAPGADDQTERQDVHAAVNTGGEVVSQTFRCDGPKEGAMGCLADQALEMVRRAV